MDEKDQETQLAKLKSDFQSKLGQDVAAIEQTFVDQILNSSADIRNKLPEEVFVKAFLPYFSGIVPMDNTSAVKANWIGIAGTPMSPVDVIDSTGNVIFTVPPLLDTSVINLTRNSREDRSIASIHDEYNLRTNHIPAVANTFISNALNNEAGKILQEVPGKMEANAKVWNSIFERYGIDTSNLNTDKPVTSNQPDPTDDVVYD